MIRVTSLAAAALAVHGLLILPLKASETPQGYFVLRAARDDASVPTSIWQDHNISGVSLRRSWASIEPAEGKFDFAYVDREIAAATTFGKRVMLHADACGANLPRWMIPRCQLYEFVERNRFSPTAGQRGKSPVPWDVAYLAAWTRCIRELGRKYANHPTVIAVHVGGPSRRGSETFLPAEVVRVPGYSADAVLSAWRQIFAAYAEAFPDTPVILNLAQPTPDRSLTAEQLTAVFERTVPHPIIQHNALAAKTSDRYAIHRLLVERGQQGAPIGFQQLCASHHPRHGGSLSTALTGARRAGARYIEIYDADRARLSGPWSDD